MIQVAVTVCLMHSRFAAETFRPVNDVRISIDIKDLVHQYYYTSSSRYPLMFYSVSFQLKLLHGFQDYLQHSLRYCHSSSLLTKFQDTNAAVCNCTITRDVSPTVDMQLSSVTYELNNLCHYNKWAEIWLLFVGYPSAIDNCEPERPEK